MSGVTGWRLNDLHKYDPRWGTGVWLGRLSASDAHFIGTLGGVILAREQRNDDVSKRAF